MHDETSTPHKKLRQWAMENAIEEIPLETMLVKLARFGIDTHLLRTVRGEWECNLYEQWVESWFAQAESATPSAAVFSAIHCALKASGE